MILTLKRSILRLISWALCLLIFVPVTTTNAQLIDPTVHLHPQEAVIGNKLFQTPIITPTSPVSSNQSGNLNLARWNPQQDIIAATDGYTITLYDSNLQLIRQIVMVSDSNLLVHSSALEWSPDGSKLAVMIYGLSFDVTGNVAQIWDVANSKILTQIPNVSSQAGFAWSPDSTQIAVIYSAGNAQDSVHIYDVQNGKCLGQFPSTPEIRNISLLAWSFNNGTMKGSQIAFEQQGYVQIWDAFTRKHITTLPMKIDGEMSLDYGENNHLAFVELEHPSDIVIWDINTSQILNRLQGHTGRLYDFIWGTGGIVSNSFDQTTRVWNPANGETISITQTGIMLPFNWNRLGNLFIAWDDTNGIHIRDAVTGDILAVFGNTLTPTPTITPTWTPTASVK